MYVGTGNRKSDNVITVGTKGAMRDQIPRNACHSGTPFLLLAVPPSAPLPFISFAMDLGEFHEDKSHIKRHFMDD
jgi:hypothetical protein